MPQIQCDIPETLAVRLQNKAAEMNLSVSQYTALLIQEGLCREYEKEVAVDNDSWPKDFFDLFGSTKNAPLERLQQGEHQKREKML